jgi:hypothetical protein
MVAQIRLRSTSDFSVENGIKIVTYGRAGVGKTVLCSTLPSPVIFSAESGLLSLQGFQLPYYEIKTIGDLKDAYQWARSSAEARQFASLCLDSVSDIAETILDSAKGKSKKDPRQAYGEYNDELLRTLKEFRDLQGKHVYMSAKQDRYKTADGLVLNGPMLPGQRMGQALPYIPDLLFQLERDPVQGYRYLRTQPDFANDAKDRSGVLDAMEQPHLGNIIAKIQQRFARQG